MTHNIIIVVLYMCFLPLYASLSFFNFIIGFIDARSVPSDTKPLFRDLAADEVSVGDLEASEIESLCMNCHENVSIE